MKWNGMNWNESDLVSQIRLTKWVLQSGERPIVVDLYNSICLLNHTQTNENAYFLVSTLFPLTRLVAIEVDFTRRKN